MNTREANRALIASKELRAEARGLADVPELAPHLFPFQAHCVDFLLRAGSGGLFLDTGLGKTACELEWCRHAAQATNGRALILTPLAVARQIEAEGKRWGYAARVVREASEVAEGINICNYDRLDRLDVSAFGAVALDESSILKSFTGATSRALREAFSGHRFRLSATATPAPNDAMELGQHAEFCGVMSSMEMLSRFFINDTSQASQQWRLKRHGVGAFWDWMASWCRMAAMPSDLGDSDEGFVLEPLRVHRHHADAQIVRGNEGSLFGAIVSATSLHSIKRETAEARARAAIQLVEAEPDEQWLMWCDTDYEADAIAKELHALPYSYAEVRGSMPVERKERNIAGFCDRYFQILVTKPSVCGFGLNLQGCARTIFVGRSFSYEQWYQAIRRLWRFGQKRAVDCHLILAAGEDQIGAVVEAKSASHVEMKAQMRAAMARSQGRKSRVRIAYEPTYEGRLPAWL